jgi:hypothetical protein
MDRLQLVSILGAVGLLLVVLELVRRRRLLERYALLWLAAAFVMLGLAGWSNGLARLAHALGIFSPPNALFLVAVGFIVVLLLHFSAAVSRLSDQSKVLAQRLAIMEQRMRKLEQDPLEDMRDRRLLEETRAARLAASTPVGSRERD